MSLFLKKIKAVGGVECMSKFVPESAFKYELGLEARDPISRFEGIIMARVHHLFGCSQYGLASKKGEDGKIPPTEYFDESRIEIIGDGMKMESIKEFDSIFTHAAGKEAKDKVTGFTGKIVYRVEYMHNSNQYGLIPEVDNDGKIPQLEQFDEGRIEIIGNGIHPDEVSAPKRGPVFNRDAPRQKSKINTNRL